MAKANGQAVKELERGALQALSPVSNDAEEIIALGEPYVAAVQIEGVAPYLYHRYSVESVAEKASAAKGSKAKKTDDIESYVWRMPNGEIAIPGDHLRGAIIGAARYMQDPRSPRKSAMDLYKAGVVVLTIVASTGRKSWDYVDQRRVQVQRSAVTRMRPALNPGWRVEFEVQITLPEYIPPATLNTVIAQAGRLCGIGDFRPTYGRFQVAHFEVR